MSVRSWASRFGPGPITVHPYFLGLAPRNLAQVPTSLGPTVFGFRFWALGFGLCASGFRALGIQIRALGVRPWTLDFWFQVSGLRALALSLGPRVLFFGHWASALGASGIVRDRFKKGHSYKIISFGTQNPRDNFCVKEIHLTKIKTISLVPRRSPTILGKSHLLLDKLA